MFCESERTECSAGSSRLLSQAVDVPRQPQHAASCAVRILQGRDSEEGPTDQGIIRFTKFPFSTASSDKLLGECK